MKKTEKIRTQKNTNHLNVKKSLRLRYEKVERETEHRMDKFLYGTSLLILILCNFFGVLLLLPFLLVFEGVQLYIIVIFFAIVFGALFNYLIQALQHLGDKHHIIAGIILPILAIVDILILLELIDIVIEKLRIFPKFDPYIVVVLFITAFILPYIVDLFRGKHRF